MDQQAVRDTLNQVLRATGSALEDLLKNLDPNLVMDWAKSVQSSSGRVVFTGVGKSGVIAQKIAATMASLGTASFFIHPTDALHGDLGNVSPKDHLVVLSNSGESDELTRFINSTKRLKVRTALITSNKTAVLSAHSDWVFAYRLPEGEGSPNDLSAPMASSACQLAIGDCLSAVLAKLNGFTGEMFSLNHPGGTIGSKLLKVREVMTSEFPIVDPDDDLVAVLTKSTEGRLGMVVVKDKGGDLLGVISDGDVRRTIQRKKEPHLLKAKDMMTPNPITIELDALAVEAANLMETKKITFVCVTNGGDQVGVLHIHDLLRLKVI
ncbi:MAG: SIS domain-containing protein [Holophagaceae bacterium]